MVTGYDICPRCKTKYSLSRNNLTNPQGVLKIGNKHLCLRCTNDILKYKNLKKFRIFKPFKKLDCEIRTITEEINEDREEVYFIVEVDYYESIGERGLINTFFYDEYPTEEEIIKDVKEDLIKDLKEYKEKILTANEEEYLKILERVLK